MKESAKERRRHIDKANTLSVVRQCELMEIHRSGLYCAPRGESELNLELMRLIDEEHMLHPWMGVPRMTAWLKKDKGIPVNKKRIERLFRLMGLSATGPQAQHLEEGQRSTP